MSELAPTPPNGNGGTPPVPALQPVASEPFKPRKIDWLYLQAVEDILASDGRVSDEQIAKRLPGKPDPETGDPRAMTREGARQIRLRRGFMDWLGAQLRSQTDRAWPAVLQRATVLAMRGSIDHMNFLAKLRGEVREPGPGGGGTANTFNGQTVVIIHE